MFVKWNAFCIIYLLCKWPERILSTNNSILNSLNIIINGTAYPTRYAYFFVTKSSCSDFVDFGIIADCLYVSILYQYLCMLLRPKFEIGLYKYIIILGGH